MSQFITITEPDGSEHILNKRYIISVEKNSKGYTSIAVGFESNDNSYIRHYATESSLDEIKRLLLSNK